MITKHSSIQRQDAGKGPFTSHKIRKTDKNHVLALQRMRGCLRAMLLHLPGRLLPLPALRLSSCSGQQTDSEEVEAVTAGQGFDGLPPARARENKIMEHNVASGGFHRFPVLLACLGPEAQSGALGWHRDGTDLRTRIQGLTEPRNS